MTQTFLPPRRLDVQYIIQCRDSALPEYTCTGGMQVQYLVSTVGGIKVSTHIFSLIELIKSNTNAFSH